MFFNIQHIILTDDEPRIVNKPKVKITLNNRGAFLTDEQHLPPLPKAPRKESNKIIASTSAATSSIAVPTPIDLDQRINIDMNKTRLEVSKTKTIMLCDLNFGGLKIPQKKTSSKRH